MTSPEPEIYHDCHGSLLRDGLPMLRSESQPVLNFSSGRVADPFSGFDLTSQTKISGARPSRTFAKGGSGNVDIMERTAVALSSIASRPCKERKDGAPLVRVGLEDQKTKAGGAPIYPGQNSAASPNARPACLLTEILQNSS